MLWLSLHFYQLPLDVFFCKQEEKAELALAENGLISYCNPMALKKGIEPGIKVSTAYAFSHTVQIKSRAYDLESDTLNQLATVAYQFSSQVCLYDEQTLVLEVGASCRLFGNLSNLLKRIKLKLDDYSEHYVSAYGQTAKLAYLISRYQGLLIGDLEQLFIDCSVAKIKRESIEKIDNIPIEELNLEANIFSLNKVKKIQSMGLKTLGELFVLPMNAIGKRFGKDFLNYLYRLKGRLADPLVLFSLPDKFSIQRHFLNGLDTVEQLLFPARPMLEQLEFYLKARRVMAPQICWRFICFNGDELFFKINLSSDVQQSKQLMELTRLKLESFILQGKVETILLTSDKMIPLNEKQQKLELFEMTEVEKSIVENNEINELMDRLKARLKQTEHFAIRFFDEYLPEKRSQLKWSESNIREDLADSKLMFVETKTQQPLWLLEPSKKIVLRGEDNDKSLNYRGRLNFHSKVERIENGWWDEPQKRDYYVMHHKNGIYYWVYRDLTAKQWMIHGVF